jgi:hypothetical protein
VAFNGTPAPVTAATETSLAVSVPPGSTTGPVTVKVGGRTATSASPFTVLQTFAIVPGSATVALGGTAGFRATLDGIATAAVAWRVNGIQGGGSDVGTINASGFYTAPNTLPAVLPIQVDAVLLSDPTRIVSATVQIVSQISGVLMAAPVAIAVMQPGGAQVIAGPVSVAVTQPAGVQVTSAPVSVSTGPVVTAVSPAAGRVGTSVSVTISGANLRSPPPDNSPPGVQVLRNGLVDPTVTVSGVTSTPDGTSVTCALTIGSAAPTGARVLRVVISQGGSTNLNIGTNVFTVQP